MEISVLTLLTLFIIFEDPFSMKSVLGTEPNGTLRSSIRRLRAESSSQYDITGLESKSPRRTDNNTVVNGKIQYLKAKISCLGQESLELSKAMIGFEDVAWGKTLSKEYKDKPETWNDMKTRTDIRIATMREELRSLMGIRDEPPPEEQKRILKLKTRKAILEEKKDQIEQRVRGSPADSEDMCKRIADEEAAIDAKLIQINEKLDELSEKRDDRWQRPEHY